MKRDGDAKASYLHLSRRERQIMDALYKEGHASVARVRELLPDAPGYSAVRALLRILEDKGWALHKNEGVQYIYEPARPREQAKDSALGHMLSTFFGGSTEAAVAALLRNEKLSKAELDRLAEVIDAARKKERR